MLYFPLTGAFLSIIFAGFLIAKVKKASEDEKIKELSGAIREGARAFLKREYQIIGVAALVLFLLLTVFISLKVGLGFLLGAAFSTSAGFIGMMVSTKANSKVATSAKESLSAALRLAFEGGSVTGFLVVGFGLLSVTLFWLLTKDIKALAGLGFGASLISVFARLGGGIYTKAADIGADLVGKVEKGIPEDDPRNPAVIADQVGDNVGDCAGMAADLFETYVVTLLATMTLGILIFNNNSALLLPLLLSAGSIVASLIATFFVKLNKKGNIMAAFYKGLTINALLSALFFLPLTFSYASKIGVNKWNLYFSSLIGLFIVFGLFVFTEYYTSKKYRPVKEIALASQSGHAPNIITGLAVGFESTFGPVLLISLGILASYLISGMYGLGISAVSLLSLTGLIIALDSYGPITDNAAGLVEMAEGEAEARKNTDALDAVGNTTKAVTKATAIGSAGLAALVLFSSYTQEIASLGKNFVFSLENPKILVGLFIGGLLPYLLASFALRAVGKAASKVVEEVRRQFREIKGLMSGTEKPQYGKCVDIVTKSSLREMIAPTILIVVIPLLTGFILGAEALGGLLIGIIITGLFVAISMSTGGAAWDNAKKYIEEGNLGGKGSPAHAAAVTGDTVGDPYKDTAGPAMNPMIKVVNIIALLIISLLI
jgi:K(+)-stimulated pyrophosphate-energized sodium pump